MDNGIYRWVKASERLPKMETVVYLRINDVMGLGNFYEQDQCYYLYVQRNGAHDEFQKPFSSVVNKDVEWLEKVEADQQEGWNEIVSRVAAADLMAKTTPGDNEAVERWKKKAIDLLSPKYTLIPKQ